MSAASFIGWAAAHALWQGTILAGLAALAFGAFRHSRPETRDRIGLAALALMVALPWLTALVTTDPFPNALRLPVLMTIDRAVPLPTYFEWRSSAIAAAGVIWAIGAAIALARLASAWRRAHMLASSGIRDAGEAVRQMVATLRIECGIPREVCVARSSVADVPMVLGWRRPIILLPDAAVLTLSRAQLRAILAHELAHVRRRDGLINLLQLVADGMLFFHPPARWLSRRIRVEREYWCDDAAISASDRAVYARALASLEDARPNCVIAVAAVSGTLVDRIARIADRPRRQLTVGRGLLILAGATALAVALFGALFAMPTAMAPGVRMRSTRPPGGMPAPPPGEQPMRSAQPAR
jgi:beta-lactamase regulating signal transducer with metallopeptidase domain